MPEWPNWTGKTVAIVASGPSAADEPLEAGRGRIPFFAVKDGWRLCPWADALYACDDHWWDAYDGVPNFAGVKIAHDPLTIAKRGGSGRFLQVTIPRGDSVDFKFDRIGKLGWGGHSGFHAINLAAQLGARRLLLIGYDLNVKRGRHFFGDHPYSQKPTDKATHLWAGILNRQAPVLAARGIEVINCSRDSALTAWPKQSFEEALHACCEVHPEPRLEAEAGRHHRLSRGNGKAGDDALRSGRGAEEKGDPAP